MKINKEKRIGTVVVIAEGEEPEFDILKGIFHEFLGYEIRLKKRSGNEVIELQGRDEYSRVILLNSPTNNINSIQNKEDYYDYLFAEVAQKYDVDLFVCPTYIVFDRDRVNNRLGVVKELICSLNQSLTDSYEQNGLLLLSYPSIEAFKMSMYDNKSYSVKFALGKDLKDYVADKAYVRRYDEASLIHAVEEFIDFLLLQKIIRVDSDVIDNMDSIGNDILDNQTTVYQKNNVFNCISQVVEMFIDLGIVEL